MTEIPEHLRRRAERARPVPPTPDLADPELERLLAEERELELKSLLTEEAELQDQYTTTLSQSRLGPGRWTLILDTSPRVGDIEYGFPRFYRDGVEVAPDEGVLDALNRADPPPSQTRD